MFSTFLFIDFVLAAQQLDGRERASVISKSKIKFVAIH